MSDEAEDPRTELVRRKAEQWAKELIDLGPRNTLLHFKNTKTGSLKLTGCDLTALEELFREKKTALRSLFLDPDDHRDACSRARNLRRKIRALREEQGLEVGKLACGLVGTPPPRTHGTSQAPGLRAPLLLRAATIQAKTASESDFTLQVGTEVELNPVLIYALQHEYGLEVDSDHFLGKVNALLAELAEQDEQLDQAFQALVGVTAEQGGKVELERSLVVGLFNYEKLPMVNDLRTATALLADHELIAAMAGYQPAQEQVQEEAAAYAPPRVDDIHPEDEYLVADADSSQHRAIETALAGQHALIEGPPGTGKSQTIANIIAGAAARGQRVLFVAEKRAAIEAVTDLLGEVELQGLVLDLHQTSINKRHIAAQLADSLARTSQQQPVDTVELHRRLTNRRARLTNYSHELHVRREPWDLSMYEVEEQLLALGPAYETGCCIRGVALAALDASTMPKIEEDLTSFVELGGLRLLRRETSWWQASVRTDEEAHEVLAELDELTGSTLRRSQDGIHHLLAQAGLPEPRDVAGWQDVLTLLEEVSDSAQAFGADIFGEQLDAMYYATAPSKERARFPEPLPWRRRRALVKQVRQICQLGIKKKRLLHDELAKIIDQRDRWRELGGPQARPSEVLGLREVIDNYDQLRKKLAAVSMCVRLEGLEYQPAERVQSTLDRLKADKEIARRLPTLHELRRRFAGAGLSDLIDTIAERDATPEQARRMLRHMRLRCLHDEFKLHSRELREFSAEQQSRLVEEFRTADVEHRSAAAQRVRRRVATMLRQTRDDYRAETRLLQTEANKKTRHLPLRKLVEQARHVLLALRPCWAMSPLIVSRTLPPEKLFDLVIFDEASQITPHEAITAIMRGKRLVVAGDDKQLPPSRWFDRMLAADDTEDEEGAALGDFNSILTTMRPTIPHSSRLRWHYRSRDERLIAFSNREFYDNDLVTFPGTALESPIRLDVVHGVAAPGQEGSSTAEVSRVVELVLEHAERRPDESLGVIALGTKHQERIDRAVDEARRDRRDLDEFFSEDVGPSRRFFVKNLETVQGDERDAIILSVGIAKRVDGTVDRRAFGPLNHENGGRRLNVAVTRAKQHMIIVSSFSPGGLAPSGDVNGTELLRRYLEAAERGGDIDRVGYATAGERNGFERDIERRLVEQGIPVYPQWGVSGYRVDFALGHPEQPGRMVLAVEADGDTYHRAQSARDRDRLRQAHLEYLGWRFHRVWASAWFADPDSETRKIVESWNSAVDYAEHPALPKPSSPIEPNRADDPTIRRGAPPRVPRGLKTQEYTEAQLIGLCRWLISDGLPLDREERVGQALTELGFRRRGSQIVPRLQRAVEIAQGLADKEED